ACLALQVSDHTAVGVDGCGQASVRVTQQPSIILDGAHAGLIQMLRPRARVPIPAIVRNVDQHTRTGGSPLTHLVWEDRLIADEDTQLSSSSRQRLTRCTTRETPHSLG